MLSPVYLFLIGIGLLYSDSLIFLPPAASYQYTDDLISIQSKNAIEPHKQHSIVARFLYNPNAKYTVLYSHGNATDIGQLKQLQDNFFKNGYSVIFYDYSGYGLSKGETTEQQVYNDIQAVYEYLIKNHNLTAQQIISYGHSLGAAIATDLAYKNPVAALILENPFTSAFRVKTTYPLVPFDKFTNTNKIDKIHAPVFIAHSRDDPIISFWHGEELFEQALEPKKSLWVNRAGHSGITHDHSYWPNLKSFVSSL